MQALRPTGYGIVNKAILIWIKIILLFTHWILVVPLSRYWSMQSGGPWGNQLHLIPPVQLWFGVANDGKDDFHSNWIIHDMGHTFSWYYRNNLAFVWVYHKFQNQRFSSWVSNKHYGRTNGRIRGRRPSAMLTSDEEYLQQRVTSKIYISRERGRQTPPPFVHLQGITYDECRESP